MSGPLRGLRGAGADMLSYRRLITPLYEIEPDDIDVNKAKGPPTKTPNEPLPDDGAKGKKDPARTRGASSRTRTDPLPSSGKDLATRIKEISAELKKKYGLPRETGERPPPPPPEETPDEPAATGPAAKDKDKNKKES